MKLVLSIVVGWPMGSHRMTSTTKTFQNNKNRNKKQNKNNMIIGIKWLTK